MLDVSHKTRTRRTARAEAVLRATPRTIERVRRREVPKGDALEVAKVAAVQAAKETPRIIPYCHPLPIDFVGVEYELGEETIRIAATVTATYKTGVEMEALTAASVAALTLYDMLKMFDENMVIESVRLLEKRGGKSDFRQAFAQPPSAAVLVLSDSAARGEKADLSGRILSERLSKAGFVVVPPAILPDEPHAISAALRAAPTNGESIWSSPRAARGSAPGTARPKPWAPSSKSRSPESPRRFALTARSGRPTPCSAADARG